MSVLLYRIATFGPAMVRSLLLMLFLGTIFIGCQETDKPVGADEVQSSLRRPWKLVCLGGSLTIGQGLSPEQAYPALVGDLLERPGRAVKVVNAGIRGETVAGAAARLGWILQQRIDALLLALGEEPQDRQLPIEEQMQHWRQLLTTLRNAYPNLPVYILVMDNQYFERNSEAWDELRSAYKLEYLQPEWETLPLGENSELSVAGQAELARWLAEQFQELPELYYENNTQ